MSLRKFSMGSNSQFQRILITGAAGFIGSHISHELLDRDCSILCIDNFNKYYSPKLKESRKKRLDARAAELNLERSRYRFEELDLRNQTLSIN